MTHLKTKLPIFSRVLEFSEVLNGSYRIFSFEIQCNLGWWVAGTFRGNGGSLWTGTASFTVYISEQGAMHGGSLWFLETVFEFFSSARSIFWFISVFICEAFNIIYSINLLFISSWGSSSFQIVNGMPEILSTKECGSMLHLILLFLRYSGSGCHYFVEFNGYILSLKPVWRLTDWFLRILKILLISWNIWWTPMQWFWSTWLEWDRYVSRTFIWSYLSPFPYHLR